VTLPQSSEGNTVNHSSERKQLNKGAQRGRDQRCQIDKGYNRASHSRYLRCWPLHTTPTCRSQKHTPLYLPLSWCMRVSLSVVSVSLFTSFSVCVTLLRVEERTSSDSHQ
jgi:hypothetical protein